MPPASTHEHDCRILETKDHRIHIKPDRTTDTRPGFFTLLFLLIFSGLTCAAALAQQSFSSSSDKVLLDAPQPAGITSSTGETDSQHMGAGTISGTVLDTNRDVVQGAQVTAAGQSGSAIRILESGSNGQFAFAELPADIYQLTVTAPGMNSFTSSVISVHGGETCLVSVTLSVFGGTSSVTVSGNQEQLAEEQVRIAVRQRLAGIFPNFTALNDWNAPPMGAKQKFQLSFRSIIDPVPLVTAAAWAGVQQYRNTFPAYGGGIEGYGKRYGANLADNVTGILLSRGVYPSIFHQDPPTFTRGRGTSDRAFYTRSLPQSLPGAMMGGGNQITRRCSAPSPPQAFRICTIRLPIAELRWSYSMVWRARVRVLSRTYFANSFSKGSLRTFPWEGWRDTDWFKRAIPDKLIDGLTSSRVLTTSAVHAIWIVHAPTQPNFHVNRLLQGPHYKSMKINGGSEWGSKPLPNRKQRI
jgi:hypothetical protein